jgi:hypothetical protein
MPHPADYHYELATVNRAGAARVHEYASDDPLRAGDIVRLRGRFWLLESVEPAEAGRARAVAKPARYRVRLRHPDGREESGAVRRYRAGAPRLGHALVTVEDGGPVKEVPDHELEHTLAARDEESLPDAAVAMLARAEREGLAVELVALEPGEEPGWEEAERFLDALILEEIEDDLLELCGVDPDRSPRDTWLSTVKERLQADLAAFRVDVEGSHEQIEEWSYRDGRILASVGSLEDEADPDSGHGWMCRLVDSSVLGAAGFERVRKVELYL